MLRFPVLAQLEPAQDDVVMRFCFANCAHSLFTASVTLDVPSNASCNGIMSSEETYVLFWRCVVASARSFCWCAFVGLLFVAVA